MKKAADLAVTAFGREFQRTCTSDPAKLRSKCSVAESAGGCKAVANLYSTEYNKSMFSIRFNRPVILTRHAALRMGERSVTQAQLLAVIDTGDTRFKDDTHLWAYKHLAGRADNLICAVLVLETAVVVKTVMHDFTVKD